MEKLLASTFNSLTFRRSDSQQVTPSVPLPSATQSREGDELFSSTFVWPHQQTARKEQAHQRPSHHHAVFFAKSVDSSGTLTKSDKLPPTQATHIAPILLHSLPRHPSIPSTCPFALKIECYLRLTNTDYKLTCEQPQHSQTKKTPWIEIGEEEYFDTNLIIDRCERELSMRASHSRRRLDYDLCGERKTVNRALLAMLEERTWWAWQLVHYVYSNSVDRFDVTISNILNGEFPLSSGNGETAALVERQQSVGSKTWNVLAEQADAAAKVGNVVCCSGSWTVELTLNFIPAHSWAVGRSLSNLR